MDFKRLRSTVIKEYADQYSDKFLLEFLKRIRIESEKNCWFISEDWSIYTTFYGEKAHRYSFRIFNPNEIIKGFYICHKCDRPGCVNPEHLFKGTHSDNMKDMRRKKRTLFVLNHRFRGLDKLRKQDQENNCIYIMEELKYKHGKP